MKRVRQYVTAYRVSHDKIKELLSEDYESLRPVLRLNVEIISEENSDEYIRIEFNTPVAAKNKRGWLNLMLWESHDTQITYHEDSKHFGERTKGSDHATKGMTEVFTTPFLNIEFTPVGISGGCPAENDNDGCFFTNNEETVFIEAETINGYKEYCDCEFEWTEPIANAMTFPMEELLGAYKVEFDRSTRTSIPYDQL